jgi:hypothetical protein
LIILEMGVSQTICPGWPQTAILLISACEVARIKGISHQCWASTLLCLAKSYSLFQELLGSLSSRKTALISTLLETHRRPYVYLPLFYNFISLSCFFHWILTTDKFYGFIICLLTWPMLRSETWPSYHSPI